MNSDPVGIGFRNGKLTVETKTDRRKNGYTIWLCRCDCGNAIELDTRTLQRGTKQDCGCVPKVSAELMGKRFGHLVCVKPDPDDKNWLCRCDCGRTCHATAYALRSGRKTCCGCLNGPKPRALLGKQFGWLTVEAYAIKKDGMQRLECVCRCGNRCEVSAAELIRKQVTDCGCGGASGADTEIYRRDSVSEQTRDNDLDTGPHAERNEAGVNWNPVNRRWIAKIGINGKSVYLGCFAEYEDAIEARRKAERDYGICVPKGLQGDLTAVCWEGAEVRKQDWDLGWRYLDPDHNLLLTTATGQTLEKWMSGCAGAVFGISEAGHDIEKMYRQAELALELCGIRREKWVYYGSRTEDDRLALLEKRTVEAAERLNGMLDMYGENCTPVTAKKILGVNAAAIREMLQDGRLQKAGRGVSVRSVFEYQENEKKITPDLW